LALAAFTKFSALAGPAAAVAFLLARFGPRAAVRLGLPYALLGLAGLAGLQWASDGEFLVNFRSLGSGGMSSQSVRIGPGRLGIALCQVSPFLLVWPVGLAVLLLRARARTFDLWDWYLLFSLCATTLIFTSPGTGFNHLLELQVAALLSLGRFLRGEDTRAVAGWALGLVVLLAGLCVLHPSSFTLHPSREELVAALPAGPLLCEDASVDVLAGRRPVVMDPFSLRVLAERGLVDDAGLARRIDRREFAVVVLLRRIERPEESLAPHFHFGPRITSALLGAYRFEGTVGQYNLYRPVRHFPREH
jgi:hypothetical protein